MPSPYLYRVLVASKPTPPGLPVNQIAVGEDAAYRIDEDTRMWQVMFR